MTLNLKDMATPKEPTQRPLPKAGPQPARILHIVDLGVQERRPFNGEQKGPVRQVWFNFELVNDEFEYKGKMEKFRVSTRPMNALTDEKSVLSKFLKSIDPEGSVGTELDKLLNKPCLVQVLHVKGTGDKAKFTYANFGGGMPVPEGYPVKELSTKPVVFSFDDPKPEAYAELPSYIKEKITSAVNYKGSKVEALVNKLASSGSADKKEEFKDDEIPF